MFAFLVLGTIWLKSEWGGGGGPKSAQPSRIEPKEMSQNRIESKHDLAKREQSQENK